MQLSFIYLFIDTEYDIAQVGSNPLCSWGFLWTPDSSASTFQTLLLQKRVHD